MASLGAAVAAPARLFALQLAWCSSDRRGAAAAGRARRAPRRRRRGPADRSSRSPSRWRRAVDRAGHRVGADHRACCSRRPSDPQDHRRRLHHRHGARPAPASPIPTRRRSGWHSPAPSTGAAGQTFTETYTGTLGPSDPGGRPGPRRARRDRRPGVGRASPSRPSASAGLPSCPRSPHRRRTRMAVALVVGTWPIRRRLLRQTARPRPPGDLRAIYEQHDAVLHSIGEGLLVRRRRPGRRAGQRRSATAARTTAQWRR